MSTPRGFDPPVGVTPPPNFATRAGSMSIFGSTTKNLAVRWNYGFAVYSLATPAAPALAYFQNLRDSGYPKNGDGSDRTGNVAASDDGQRVLVPWTDSAGFGTIAMGPSTTGFYAAGDYLPNVAFGQDSRVAVLTVGSRYLGFTLVSGQLYVADLTTLPTSGSGTPGNIPAELVSAVTVFNGMVLDMVAFQGGGKSWVVINGYNKIFVGDVSNPGTAPSISGGFVWRTLSVTDFTPPGAPAWSAFRSVAGAVHPVDGVPYIMAEGVGTPSPGVSLVRFDPTTGTASPKGSFLPAAPYNLQTTASTLVPYDTEVLGLFLSKSSTDATKLYAVSSGDFSRDLAPDAALGIVSGTGLLLALRGTSTSLTIYSGSQTGAWASGLNCVLSNAPATPSLTAEKIPPTGGTIALKSGDAVFLGDLIRIYPKVSPPATAQALTDWRFDFDYHTQPTATESGAIYPRVKQPDLCLTCPGGTATPPASLDLIGPCDPRNTTPTAPNVATGAGCWTSVTTNDLQDGPDFPPATAPTQTTLTLALEAQNALNVSPAPASGLSAFSLLWTVPQPRVKVASILFGDWTTLPLQDGSDGSPDTASLSWEWYFAANAGDTALVRDATCTGATCAHVFPGKGTFGYYLKVPYRNGYATPDCTKDGSGNCTNALGTIVVSDVSLALTAPASVYRTNPSIIVPSQSRKGTTVTGTFGYEICPSPCSTTPTAGTATISGDPFSALGTGSVNLPMPATAGTYDIRLNYAYTGPAGCAPCTVSWPSQTTWKQVVVSNAMPSIKLMTTTGADLCFGSSCAIYTGDTGKAYAYVNGVVDNPPPSGMQWSWDASNPTNVSATGSTAQGASFSYATAGTYTITLKGYGGTFSQDIYVADKPVGGGGGGGGSTTSGPTVTSLSWSPRNPDPAQAATFTCSAYAGTSPIQSYKFIWNDNTSATTSTSSTATHSFATVGSKTVFCQAWDSAGYYGQAIGYVTVGSSSGSCDFQIKDTNGARISFDPVTGSYDAETGKTLTFDASGTSGTVSWNFGDGSTGTGDPTTHVYTVPSLTGYTVTLSGAGCSKSYTIYVSQATPSIDFTIADATSGTALAKTGDTYEARAGQSLRFTSSGTTGAVAWAFGDGETSTEASPVKTYGPLVDTPYTASLTNGGITRQYTVSVKGSTGAPLTGNYTYRYADGTSVNRLAVQPNKAIIFTAADVAETYIWDFGDGSSTSSGSPMTHAFTMGGSFTVRLTTGRTGLTPVTTPVPTQFTVLPPPDPLLWVAGGAAYVDGSKGELFQSDLSIFNPGSQSATVSLAFVSGAEWVDYTKLSWTPVAIVAGGTEVFTNILSTLFHKSKPSYGVVLVRGDVIQVAPVIVGRTYNAADPVAGTFGLSVPAMSVAGGVKPQSAAGGNFLVGLREDGSFRTNLTVANLKDETAEVNVVFRDAAGNVLGSPALVRVEARGVKQLNGALSAPPAAVDGAMGGAGWTNPTSNFSAEVKITKGSGVYPYATVIDQGTGDSIVVSPVSHPSATYRLPGIVRVPGKNGPFWVSDVALLNPSAKTRKVLVNFSYVKSGSTGRREVTDTFTLAPYQMAVANDFVRTWLALPASDDGGYLSSFVDFTPAPDDPAPTEPILVGGKTYTPSGKGSIGLQVDPFTIDDGISQTSSRKRIVLSGLAVNANYRTNLALFLAPGTTGSVQVNVRVLDGFGREVTRIDNVGLDTVTPFVQLGSDSLFPGLVTDDASRATIIIDSPRGTAVLAAYATVIDNRSEDGTFVAGQPVP